MTSTTQKIEQPVIHAAKIFRKGKGQIFLLLRKIAKEEYRWFEVADDSENFTSITGPTIEEAISKARKEFASSSFRTINCGFRYTLPERDEHGMNALFYQMKASLFSFNGVYFDEEVQHNCLVQNASQEAKDLMNLLKEKGKL